MTEKRKTKWRSALVVCALLCAMLMSILAPIGVYASSIAPTSGTCGNNARWAFSNGRLVISGSGAIQYYGPETEVPWEALKSQITTLVIQDGITSTTRVLFRNCSNLKQVYIADSVTDIAPGMFINCSSLTNIRIPKCTKSIGPLAFVGCSRLNSVQLPKALVTIGHRAFNDASNLRDIYYEGNETAWKKIHWEEDLNGVVSYPSSATVHYSSYDTTTTTSINISGRTTMRVGEIQTLSVNIYPVTSNTKIKWNSSEPGVARVDANGRVIAKGGGDTLITAEIPNTNIRASINIEVTEQTPERYYKLDNICIPFDQSAITKEPIPFSIYQRVYGDAAQNEYKSDKSKGTGGVCAGFGISALMFYNGYKNTNNYGAKSIDMLLPNERLNNLIRYNYLSQNLGSYADARSKYGVFQYTINKANKIEEIANYAKTHEYTYLAIGKSGSGHALIAYHFTENTGDDDGKICSKIYVYDCNNPYDYESYIALYKKDANTYSGDWAFKTSLSYNYDSDQLGARLSYIPYSVLLSSAQRGDIQLMSLDETIQNITIIQNGTSIMINDKDSNSFSVNNGNMVDSSLPNVVYYDEYWLENNTNKLKLQNGEYSISGSNESKSVNTTIYSSSDSMLATTTNNSKINFHIRDVATETIEANNFINIDNQSVSSDYSISYMPHASIYGYNYDTITISGNSDGIIKTHEKDGNIYVSGDDALKFSVTVGNNTVSTFAENLDVNSEYCVSINTATDIPAIQILLNDEEITESIALPERQKTPHPTYNLASGEYTGGQELSLTHPNEMVSLYYTTDGSDPEEDISMVYSTPIRIDKTMTVKILATQYGCENSDILELTYNLPEVQVPFANVEAGTYNRNKVVELGHEENVEIYYTMDGSDPTEYGRLYTTPITIYEDTTLMACAVQNGVTSEVLELEYIIDHAAPFYFSESIINQDGELIDSENMTNLTKVTAIVNKTTDTDVGAMFILGIYDENDVLLKMQLCSVEQIEDGQLVEFTTTPTERAKKIKLLAWENFFTIRQLCDPLIIE